MFTKATLGLAVILLTASGALAAKKSHSVVAPSSTTYSASTHRNGVYVGADPDLNIRFELNRDYAHAKYY
jgi:hypothetical protein